MRVMVATQAVNSHLYNIVPMAWALRAAGHEVCVATQPNLLEEAKRTGLTAVAVGDELPAARGGLDTADTPYGLTHDITETDPATLTAEYIRGVFADYTSVVCEYSSNQAVLDDLVEFGRAWRPDLLLWDAHTYAGSVASRALGIADARMLPAPDHWARLRTRFLELTGGGSGDDDPLAGYLGEKLAKYGCDFDESVVFGRATIDPLPSWLGIPVEPNHWPVRHIPYSGPSVIPAWLRKEPRRRRVCLTLGQTRRSLGSAAGDNDDRAPAVAFLEALASLDVEIVATLNASQIPAGTSIPDNVRLFDYLPLNALLPSCAAVIHYGGMGTVNVAVAHGVPQLSIPGNIWGERGIMQAVSAQGAGLIADPDNLVEKLRDILDNDGFRESALRIRDEMLSRPSPRDLVPQLESLAAPAAA